MTELKHQQFSTASVHPNNNLYHPTATDHARTLGGETAATHGSGLVAGVDLAAVGVVEAARRRRVHGHRPRPGPRPAVHRRRRHRHEQADLHDEEDQEHAEAVARHGLDLQGS